MDDSDAAVETLAQKIRHHIITTSGRTFKDATTKEFYQAFCLTLREEVMINWTALQKTIEQKKVRTAYLLSMEYLPGRFLNNNILNIGASSLVQAVLTKLERNYTDLLA